MYSSARRGEGCHRSFWGPEGSVPTSNDHLRSRQKLDNAFPLGNFDDKDYPCDCLVNQRLPVMPTVSQTSEPFSAESIFFGCERRQSFSSRLSQVHASGARKSSEEIPRDKKKIA